MVLDGLGTRYILRCSHVLEFVLQSAWPSESGCPMLTVTCIASRTHELLKKRNNRKSANLNLLYLVDQTVETFDYFLPLKEALSIRDNHASERAQFINVCYRCLTYIPRSYLPLQGRSKNGALQQWWRFTTIAQNSYQANTVSQWVNSHSPYYIINRPSLPVDRLNGLPAGSTIVVENTSSKQQLNRTTTNKGKKLKSGNTIVWEANLRR